MKTRVMITSAMAVFLFANVLFAGNPQVVALKMLQRLNKDIVLTDEQKQAVLVSAQTYAKKMNEVSPLIEIYNSISIKEGLAQEYELTLDSILTQTQKELLVQKISERQQISENKYQMNK